jgi:hypothetical protein
LTTAITSCGRAAILTEMQKVVDLGVTTASRGHLSVMERLTELDPGEGVVDAVALGVFG